MKRSKIPINKKDRELIWVHTDYKKFIKSEASLQGKNLLEYTREAAHKRMSIIDRDDAEMNIKINMKKPRWEKLF